MSKPTSSAPDDDRGGSGAVPPGFGTEESGAHPGGSGYRDAGSDPSAGATDANGTSSETTEPIPVAEPTQPMRSGTAQPARPVVDPLRGSRTSGTFVGLAVAVVVLVLLIIFIVQNTRAAEVHFLTLKGSPPLSVSMLIAFVAGMLVTVLVGGMRIMQLRRRVKKDVRARKKADKADQAAAS